MSDQAQLVVDHSSWTVQAALTPAFKRAAHFGTGIIGTDDLLVEFARRVARRFPGLKPLRTSQSGQARGAGSDEPSLDLEGGFYESRAILREVAVHAAKSSVGGNFRSSPGWTRAVGEVLSEARVRSAEAGLPWAGDREVLLALLSKEGTYAHALLTAEEVDKGQLVAQIESGTSHYGKHPWVPAVDFLEMVGVAPSGSIARLMMLPIRAAFKRVDGRSAGLLAALRSESERQCLRMGHERVRISHVLLGIASLSHQLSLVRMEEPPQMRGVGVMLHDSGVSYLALSRCISERLISQLQEGPLGLKDGRVSPDPPEMSTEVRRLFDVIGALADEVDGYSRMVERVLDEKDLVGIIRECRSGA